MKSKGDVVGLVSESEPVCLSVSNFVAFGTFCAYRDEGFLHFVVLLCLLISEGRMADLSAF